MKKLIILLVLAVLVITVSGCTFISATSSPTTSITAPQTSTSTTSSQPDTNKPTSTTQISSSQDNPVPLGQSAINAEGIEITVLSLTSGGQAWEIIENANSVNVPPAAGMQYILITIKVNNISSRQEPYTFWGTYFELVGGSGKVFHAYDINIIYPTNGIYQKLEADLHHGDEFTGSIHFYIPQSETGLTLVWSDYYGYNKLFFAVR
jgi:uncharacterized protein YceK